MIVAEIKPLAEIKDMAKNIKKYWLQGVGLVLPSVSLVEENRLNYSHPPSEQ